MVRAFIAVKVPSNPSLVEAVSELARMGRGVKAVDAANLHITLKFLGDVADSKIQDVVQVIRAAGALAKATELGLVGVGCFPDERRPKVVWAGSRGGEALADAAARLEDGLAGLGFERERRRFVVHLTLARVRDDPPKDLQSFLERHRSMDFGKARISSIDLFRSDLLPSGPRYTVLESVGLV
ncbi:MAG: RNA 2',3'-cyclic phosphodiesterase [Euryarchaeota archaeon]|nr:RNA 2',3'-cyclic phosphodiesterase [Euryarchaeota archaeon]